MAPVSLLSLQRGKHSQERGAGLKQRKEHEEKKRVKGKETEEGEGERVRE